MPKKIQQVTKAHLISVPLPNHGASYTVISHQFVIDYAYQALANAGFGIVDEQYRCTADGQIAHGIYKLQFNNDPELSMMFAWTNSYNKQVKFQCVIGAYINSTGSVMISGEIGSWVRKHTGTADTETKEIIDDYITNAYMYYNQLVSDKAVMEQMTLNLRKQSQLLGVLFAEYEILTTEQASIVRSQMSRPSYAFSNKDSLWAFYNYVTIALQSSHPKTWMEDQRILHYFISTIADFQKVSTPPPVVSTPVPDLSTPVDPLTTNYGEPENQTNLLVQIAEVTGDESVLEPQIDETIQYTDPAGNTFEAPVVEPASRLSLDDILIRIPNQMKEEVEEVQVSENQVVQEEVENTTVLHQLDEMTLDLDDFTETSLKTDDAETDLTELEEEGKNEPKILETNFPTDDTFELNDFSDVSDEESDDDIPDFF
jgi:hypothetical protein